MKPLKTYLQTIAIFVLLGASLSARADTVVYQTGCSNAFITTYWGAQATSIYSGNPTGTAGKSGEPAVGFSHLFGQSETRGLIRFDLSSLAGQYGTITSVSLQLETAQINTDPKYLPNGTVNAYAILPADTSWGQLTASWNYPNVATQPWAGAVGVSTAGTDYNPTLLGSFTYNSLGTYTLNFTGLNSAQLTSLITSWTEANNPGLLLIDPVSTDAYVRFVGTSETYGPSFYTHSPKLTITYNPAYSGTDANGLIYTAVNGQVTITGYSGSGGALIIPSSISVYGVSLPVTTIADSAFASKNLTSVTIPSGVTSIGNLAFSGCPNLRSAIFAGNAPTLGTTPFLNDASGFKVYYFTGATGFTSSPWTGYTTVNAGVYPPSYSPIVPWFISNGFAYNTPLTAVPNNDGVPLLMDYALNLDPTKNQSASMPKPTVSGNQMSLTYYGGSAGVTYTVLASTDLQSWSASGVTVSGPDANGNYTATIPISSTKEFLRLKVTY